MSTDALPPTIGRFRVLRALGKGGMGAVYLAEDTLLHRRVAVKVPLLTRKDNPQVIERFLREAQAAAAIDHPNVCPVLEVGEQGDGYYLVMPFLEGTPLNKMTATDHPWQPGPAIGLLVKLAGGVQAIHAKGLIHRDLKPGNVLIRADGEPVILDLGLARSLDGATELTGKGQAVGTPAYMAPEQLMGDTAKLGPATDVYALGVILYQLLTGQLPFGGPVHAVYAQILQAPPPAPSAVRPGLDPGLDALCRQAMAKEPAERPPSASAFAERLEADRPATVTEVVPVDPPKEAVEGAPETVSAVVTAGPGEGVVCPGCGKRLRLPPRFTGQRTRCPACKVPMAISTDLTAPGHKPDPPRRARTFGPVGVALMAGLLLVTLVGLLGAGGLFLWRMSPEPGPLAAVPKGVPEAEDWGLRSVEEVTLSPGGTEAARVRIFRKGFRGPVELGGARFPEGLTVGGTLPAGEESGMVSVVAGQAVLPGRYEGELLAESNNGKESLRFVVTVRSKMVTNSIGMKLALIPAGKFMMGSPETEEGRYTDEGPQHEVEITRPFYLGVYEVTQAEYQAVMGVNPSSFAATGASSDMVKGVDTSAFPVENVSWDDAKKFCDLLSAREEEKGAGRVYRLPTEAEWEYACRAGTTTPYHLGDRLTADLANFGYVGRTTRVGSYKSNGWGLYDMHGNVSEWCADWYDFAYYAKSPRADPQGPATGSVLAARVVRSGSWGSSHACQSAKRSNSSPTYRSSFGGFRVALVLSGK